MKNTVIITSLILFTAIYSRKEMSPLNENRSLLSKEDSKLIDSLFIDFSGNRPGAVVMIAKRNEILFFKSYGLMNLDEKIPPTFTTKYHLASTSKQFTAMAILKMVDTGKLSFSTTLSEIFPDYPEFGKSITIQHLLTHQSGIPEVNKLDDSDDNRLLTDLDRLELSMKNNTLQLTPGTKFQYSNTGYSILAAVVSEVSGMPFEEFMHKEIFDPIGMNSTEYYPSAENPNVGYHILEESIKLAKGASDAIMGSGSVYISMEDYFKWHLALCNESIVSPELHKLSYLPQEDTENQWGTYGYGWYTHKKQGIEYVTHGGVTQSCGFVTFTARIPKEKITVAIFTNRAWSRANIPSQNIGNRAKVLLSIASDRKLTLPPLDKIDPEPKKSLAQAFYDKLIANGIESAKVFFDNSNGSEKYYLKEKEMNNVGHALLNMERIKDAIEVFKLNIELHPASWKAYDELAEAYMSDSNKVNAIKFYEKSLQINPNNKNATDQISKMKKE